MIEETNQQQGANTQVARKTNYSGASTRFCEVKSSEVGLELLKQMIYIDSEYPEKGYREEVIYSPEFVALDSRLTELLDQAEMRGKNVDFLREEYNSLVEVLNKVWADELRNQREKGIEQAKARKGPRIRQHSVRRPVKPLFKR